MKTGEAERYLKEELEQIYDQMEASRIADLAMESVTGLSRSQRLPHSDKELNATQSGILLQHLDRLKSHEPIQYIMNKCWFYGMELFINRNVLIPRPETEELVQWIIDDMKSAGKDVFDRKPAEADDTKNLKILDVGTGSGCIALALKRAMPKAEVWGCDLSEQALDIARRNGSELDIRVDFQGTDFLDEPQQKLLPTTDIIVSNPPYIPANNKDNMDRNVLEFEPHIALFVPDSDALRFYKALAEFGKKRLYPAGSIYTEIHEDLGRDVTALFKQQGYKTELRKDMQGKDRMVKAWK